MKPSRELASTGVRFDIITGAAWARELPRARARRRGARARLLKQIAAPSGKVMILDGLGGRDS